MTNEESPLRLEIRAGLKVAIATIDRPPVNAIDPALQRAIRETFASFAERRDVNAVILTAAGRRAFSAGVDLRARQAVQESRPLDPGKVWRDAKDAVYGCAIPVIGAINGVAIGAGAGLASVCDVIIAADHATFGITEINVGLLGGGSAAYRMVGPYKMRKMFYTGEMVTAQEMHRLGAVEEVVPYDDLMPAALALATKIASKSPIGLRLAKESLTRMENFLLDWGGAYRMEQDYTNRINTFEDSKEGTSAFMEKRDAEWKWR